ncbi:MAG: low-specificity L-threonine aldolase [Chloroflexi bacterium]|nr:low-specificity L-threonine aldolase [Chloroflexota bacterium]
MKKVIDLRSDTITHPTPEMREAMYRAELGDDGWGDDPTVNRLQELAAERLGKEAALLVPSGTMGNLVSILSQAERGTEIILGDRSHTFTTESGGVSAVGGIHVWALPNDRFGRLDPAQVEAAIRPSGNVHYPRTALICLENTHNRCSGAVLSPEYISTIAALGRRAGVPLHLDGARVFNAAVALEMDPVELVRPFASVTFCLSKGLCCPIGSLICGSAEFIARARFWRQMVGGGMRQAGIIAAAGIVALESMIDRLAEDHEHARMLAEGLAHLPGLTLDLEPIQTNIVIMQVQAMSGEEFAGRLEAEGIRVSRMGPNLVRMVTHYGITRSDMQEAVRAAARILAE